MSGKEALPASRGACDAARERAIHGALAGALFCRLFPPRMQGVLGGCGVDARLSATASGENAGSALFFHLLASIRKRATATAPMMQKWTHRAIFALLLSSSLARSAAALCHLSERASVSSDSTCR